MHLGTVLLISLLTASFAVTASETNDEIAEDFTQSLSAIIDTVQIPEVDQSELAKYIDFPSITRGVLGKHRDTLSKDQTSRFQGEFEKSMLALLRTATEATGEFEIEITQTKLSKKRKNSGQAYATIKPEKGDKLSIIASVGKKEHGWMVRNLIFEGINLGLTYRNQFDQLMVNHNGDADAAIDAWAASATESTDL